VTARNNADSSRPVFFSMGFSTGAVGIANVGARPHLEVGCFLRPCAGVDVDDESGIEQLRRAVQAKMRTSHPAAVASLCGLPLNVIEFFATTEARLPPAALDKIACALLPNARYDPATDRLWVTE
jgi:hypothetical protein